MDARGPRDKQCSFSAMTEHVILGCGYTGRRVAERLLATGARVTATTRDPDRLRDLSARGCKILPIDLMESNGLPDAVREAARGSSVLLSVPPIKGPRGFLDPTPRIVREFGDGPRRVVYLSTTGVYGSIKLVDETTLVAPVTERQHLRTAAEEAVAGGPWPSMILRPAAIYGPGRGVHTVMQQDRFRLAGDGSNFVSRIQVDDLAAITLAALESSLTGAYPVADDEPSTSREIAEFCARLLGLPLPGSVSERELSETRRSDRRVDGSAVRRILGVDLQYPSYRTGIPAALAEEAAAVPRKPSRLGLTDD